MEHPSFILAHLFDFVNRNLFFFREDSLRVYCNAFVCSRIRVCSPLCHTEAKQLLPSLLGIAGHAVRLLVLSALHITQDSCQKWG